MKKIIFITFFLFKIPVFAQVSETTTTDSTQNVYPWRARTTVLGINILINRYDAHIKGGGGQDFAKVTPASWWNNIKYGLESDWNSFYTNWIQHPFHGSMLFNAGRVNGKNFWESIPYAVGGSLMWEYLGETHPPSDIDLINTSLGGIYLGEMLYRLSEQILDDRASGSTRLWRELTAGLLNPVGGANRLMFGNAWKIHAKRNHKRIPISAQFFFGTNYPLRTINDSKYSTGPVLDLTLSYGNPFTIKKEFYKPFDFFILRTWFNIPQDSAHSVVLINVSSHAMLLGKKVRDTPFKTDILGVSQHYDYIHNRLIEIGAMSVSGGWTGRRYWGNKWRFISSAHLGLVLLGSSNSEIINLLRIEDDPEMLRDYIIGPGFMGEVEIMLRHTQWGYIIANYNRWSFYVSSPPKGDEHVNLLRLRYFLPIWKGITLGLEYSYYHRLAYYDNVHGYEQLSARQYEFRTMIGWKF